MSLIRDRDILHTTLVVAIVIVAQSSSLRELLSAFPIKCSACKLHCAWSQSSQCSHRCRTMPALGLYYPSDERSMWFADKNLEPIAGLPMLDDHFQVSLRPTSGVGLKSVRDEYNNTKPMHLILQNFWVGSKWAGHCSPTCLDNGITHVMCVAAGHQLDNRRCRGRYGRQVIQMDQIDLNKIVETPSPRKHDTTDLGFYQDYSREEHSCSRNT